jgi:hypothetical protein
MILIFIGIEYINYIDDTNQNIRVRWQHLLRCTQVSRQYQYQKFYSLISSFWLHFRFERSISELWNWQIILGKYSLVVVR